nr:MAG TPA: hypothetical protein [Caudoviricetes sp.]
MSRLRRYSFAHVIRCLEELYHIISVLSILTLLLLLLYTIDLLFICWFLTTYIYSNFNCQAINIKYLLYSITISWFSTIRRHI